MADDIHILLVRCVDGACRCINHKALSDEQVDRLVEKIEDIDPYETIPLDLEEYSSGENESKGQME